jgi:magnesium chelatase family protein
MAVIINSIGLKGMEGYRVRVEIHLLPGLESMTIVGLPDASVKESKDRVMAALHSSFGDLLPDKKIVVNLSPAEQRKNGPFFDLAIAVGMLKSIGKIYEKISMDTAFLGALSLDGTLQPVEGMLPAVLAAKRCGMKRLVLPFDEHLPVQSIAGIELVFVHTLDDVIKTLSGQTLLPIGEVSRHTAPPSITYDHDFAHVLGHHQAKRALEIAAAGAHNVLMSGPPGCGKSLLSSTFPSILPTLSQDALLEVMSLYQLAGETPLHSLMPPFRHPHHSASSVAIIGGGSYPKPGEVSLAHHGVLFLDEMAEFTKKTLDMLRQPLETGKVTISRAHSTVTYPARFILLGAMNPCPCGYLGSHKHYCTCTENQIRTYRNRVSGPIYDRIDILLSLQSVRLDQFTSDKNETSAAIRSRVENARQRQYERYGEEICNADVTLEVLNRTSPLSGSQQRMLQQRSSQQQWSNRVQIKIIRLARTIADLKGEKEITDEAIWEAMTLRRTSKLAKQQRPSEHA